MFRTITLTLTLTLSALLPFAAQATEVTQGGPIGSNYSVLDASIDLSGLGGDDAVDLAEELGCEIQKDGTCLIPGDQWEPASGTDGFGDQWLIPGDQWEGKPHMDFNPVIGALFVEDFEINKDGSIEIFGSIELFDSDSKGVEVDVFLTPCAGDTRK